MKEFTLIMRFVVIGIIYIVLFKIIWVMYKDLRGIRRKDTSLDYALEVIVAPDRIGISKGCVFPIRSTTNIGRKEDNEVMIDDPYVSGHHAAISVKDGKIYLKDMRSKNGTILNGRKVDNVQEIYDGDTLEIGRIIFKVIG